MALDRQGERLGGALPSATKGLVRLPDDAWLHFSRKGTTVKLREVKAEGLGKSDTFDLSDAARLNEVLERTSGALFYAGWPLAGAHEGRDRLSRGRRCSPVPQTQLRSLYQVLRDFDDSKVGRATLENTLRKRGRTLLKYFENSYEQFDQYSNVNENFGGGTHRKKDGHFKFAERLARTLEASGQWAGDSKLGFDFVAREVNFRRTSGGAFFEDGTLARSSGAGGVDLLLRAHEGGLPIVGEIKASTDTNAFVALVQALTYACELVTPAQLDRLERHYPQRFPPGLLTSSEGPHADIYLICEGPTALSEKTHELADCLLKDRQHRLGRHIRKIVCHRTPLGGGWDDLVLEWLVE